MKDIILFGAGTIGRLIARQLILKGKTPIAFADNDPQKWGTRVEGIQISSPDYLKIFAPEATWIATVLRTPFKQEIEFQLKEMGVETESVSNYFSRSFCPMDEETVNLLINLSSDEKTKDEIWNQRDLRIHGDRHAPIPMDDIRDVYFPPFIKHHLNEVFIDCGAADGDTVKEVLKRWRSVKIISIEPDRENYDAFQSKHFPPNVHLIFGAVSDFNGSASFTATGDQTAHFGNGNKVPVHKLDTLLKEEKPTFIKMDIEGAELEALWGARETILKHSPVLAICAYHTADHLWQIPLLVKALNPSYSLYLRRYLEGSWELIYYAVPPERIK